MIRTNYGNKIYNNQDEKIWDNPEYTDIMLLEKDFSESYVFLSEEIQGNCRKKYCEISTEKFPIFMKKFLETNDNLYWFGEDFGFKKVEMDEKKLKIFFQDYQILSDNFIFFVSKTH